MPASPFRDELACAHDALERLRRDNHALRQQLDRVPVRTRPSLLVPLTTAWAILMTASLVRVTAREIPPTSAPAAVMRIPAAPPPVYGVCAPPKLGPPPFNLHELGF